MMRLLNNKCGGKILSIYWFAILLIVAAGIFAMVYVFYGTPYDVREIEANLLVEKISDCISYAGRINSNLISDGMVQNNDDFLEECHLVFDSPEWEEQQYYFEIDFYEPENLDESILNIKEGNSRWPVYCAIQENTEYEKLAKCVYGNFYSVDDSDNQYIIKILMVLAKSDKNVKI